MSTLSTVNQIFNLIKNEDFSKKNILELGYQPSEKVTSLRNFFTDRGANFFRTNLDLDQGIDFVWDLHKPKPKNSPHKNYDYVICSSVMEHVARPWVAARNIEDIIAKGGKLIWTTPWVWRIHGYPSDFWRFTPEGVKQLFSKLTWEWVGIEILFDGSTSKNRSILVEWSEDMKDPVFGMRKDSLRNLIKGKIDVFEIKGNNGSKSSIDVSLVENDNFEVCKKIDTYNLNETIYNGLILDSELLLLQPMSAFIMIGKKN